MKWNFKLKFNYVASVLADNEQRERAKAAEEQKVSQNSSLVLSIRSLKRKTKNLILWVTIPSNFFIRK